MIPRAFLRDRFQAAIVAVEPAAAVRASLRREGEWLHCGEWRQRLPRPGCGRVVVIGAGKASAPMAQAVEAVLGERITGGCVVVKYGHTAPLERVHLLEAGHPVPDAAGVCGALAIERAVYGLGVDDVVICCLSGGASALLPAPRAEVTLADKQMVTSLLLASGADIYAINTVRKHLSRLKGGRLALACAPASVLTLVISDVIGDDLSVIGSGPTAADATTDAQALAVLQRHVPPEKIPPTVLTALMSCVDWTPKPHDVRLARVHHQVIASNTLAVAAAGDVRQLGRDFEVKTCMAEPLSGEAWLAAEHFCRQASALPPGSLLIGGGETTVSLGAEPGIGGRNQEFALAAARWIMAHAAPLTVLAAGTDGNDGPTDAAGGVVDGGTWGRAVAAGADPHRALAQHDAYPVLRAAGDLLLTGPTNTNVMDLALAWRH